MMRRNASPAVIAIAVVLLLIVLGVGGFYAYTGGGKTAAQQDEKKKQEVMPLLAAKRGDMEALEAENKYRKEHGQPLLELPKDRHENSANMRSKLDALQQKINAKG